jgi:Transglutaminase-like superfamily
MGPLTNLRQFALSDRYLLVQAALLVVLIRIGLWLLPFRTVRRLLPRRRSTLPARPGGDPSSIDRVAGAVTRVSRCVPAATCLTQALAALVLLRRRGIPCRLHIGVAKDRRGRLIAHAWVESQGRIVIGGPSLGRYSSLLVVEEGNA